LSCDLIAVIHRPGLRKEAPPEEVEPDTARPRRANPLAAGPQDGLRDAGTLGPGFVH
jgi:hypothetical protein